MSDTIKTDLILNQLRIVRNASYDTNPGRYRAEVEYKTVSSETKLMLHPEVAEKLLAWLAPLLVQYAAKEAGEVAENIKRSIDALAPSVQIEDTKPETAP